MTAKNKIIVLRFSAMGDVAMVASVLSEFVLQNPDGEIIMVSRNAFKPFFDGIPNLSFHPIEPKTAHRGVVGLYRLFKELLKYNSYAVADLHDNLRSRVLSSFLRLKGMRIRRIDKGRAEKKALTRNENKILRQLTPTVERYANVFRELGYGLRLSHQLQKRLKALPPALSGLLAGKDMVSIGISPFAQHEYKVYPLSKMERVIGHLSALNYQVFIFGGGADEGIIAEKWAMQFLNVRNLIGKFTLTEELAAISHLDLMLSMDSSGMHMASLMGVPVVSVWGPTHPFAGFLGYGQNIEDCVQIEHPARPSSIYGNKPCLCGDESCISLIEPLVIVNKIKERLSYG